MANLRMNSKLVCVTSPYHSHLAESFWTEYELNVFTHESIVRENKIIYPTLFLLLKSIDNFFVTLKTTLDYLNTPLLEFRIIII